MERELSKESKFELLNLYSSPSTLFFAGSLSGLLLILLFVLAMFVFSFFVGSSFITSYKFTAQDFSENNL
jgi:hypothetical protein